MGLTAILQWDILATPNSSLSREARKAPSPERFSSGARCLPIFSLKFFPLPLAPRMAAWEVGVPGSAAHKGDRITRHPAGLQLTQDPAWHPNS